MPPRAPSSSALAARRKTLAASARRHPRKAPAGSPPTGPASAFALALQRLLRPLDDAWREVLRDAGFSEVVTGSNSRRSDAQGDPVSSPRTDAQGDVPDVPKVTVPPETIRRAQRAMARAARDLAGSKALQDALARAARATDAHSRAIWNAQAEALGLDVTGDDLFLSARMGAFRKENLGLIRSLCAEHVVRVGKVLRENAGARVETIARELQESVGVSRSRAQLLARDQVLRVNSQLTQDRHEAAGIVEYTWSASRDQRVRSEHRELDGRRFRYDDPPIADKRSGRRGNPGTVWQCRCVAIPVLPD